MQCTRQAYHKWKKTAATSQRKRGGMKRESLACQLCQHEPQAMDKRNHHARTVPGRCRLMVRRDLESNRKQLKG